ncbi:hypothetical protein OG259_07575 [Streptomyces sp. NBC_00250]|uniref:hypothetical protein n=1 Tax=Streptomyces sp. NBC_00250 TaxID=2903641 RepID=UPI002E28527B|nr:hypothetical protein [Streptomyces sp. NBC_00250]
MAIKRCKAAFAANINGAPHMFTVGQLVADDHPVIKGREALFEDVETYVSDRSASRVEQATAAPGEKRSVGRGAAKKVAAKKPDAQPDSGSSEGGTK